jgi:ankyrin repeat protein
MNDIGFEALSDMIFHDKSDAIRHYVGAHPDCVRFRSDEGDTLLHLACWAKRLDVVLATIGAGADVNARGDSGQTPLHYAVYEGDRNSLPIVDVLLSHGADPAMIDDCGFSVADLANLSMTEGLSEVLEQLQGGSSKRRDDGDDGPSGLHGYARRGADETLRRILIDRPDLIDARDSRGDTLLHVACVEKQYVVGDMLCGRGANLNAKGHEGRTALHYAVQEGRAISLSIVFSLLKYGADPRIRDDRGLTPGEFARSQMSDQLPKVLELLDDATRGLDAGRHGQEYKLRKQIATLEEMLRGIDRDRSRELEQPNPNRLIAGLQSLLSHLRDQLAQSRSDS